MSKPQMSKLKNVHVVFNDMSSGVLKHGEFVDAKRSNKVKYHTQEGWNCWIDFKGDSIKPGEA